MDALEQREKLRSEWLRLSTEYSGLISELASNGDLMKHSEREAKRNRAKEIDERVQLIKVELDAV